MLFNTIAASSILVASALAVAEPAPYKLETLGKMSYNNAFGLSKRQAGYEPSQTFCGPGTDCPSSCGATYIQCSSSDGDLHCYDPSIKQSCCPDGTGNSCDAGYFCTSDSTGGTWCCPDGLSLTECAAIFSVTGGLVSQTAAPTVVVPSSTPSAVSAATTPLSASTSTSPAQISSSIPVAASSLTSTSAYSVTTSAIKITPSISSVSSSFANGTSTTSSPPVQVTGGAARFSFAGLPAIALAAGAFLL